MENMWSKSNIIDEENKEIKRSILIIIMILTVFVFFFLLYPHQREYHYVGVITKEGEKNYIQIIMTPEKYNQIQNMKLWIEGKRYSYKIIQIEPFHEKEIVVTLSCTYDKKIMGIYMTFKGKKTTLLHKLLYTN